MTTESRNPLTKHIDRCATSEMLRLIQDENRRSVEAVETALPAVERACDVAAASLASGGRLIYVGAGTSGRLAVCDAAECPPTFGVSADTVCAVMAGGREAMFCAAENQEDNTEAGRAALAALHPDSRDTVVGISASGNAAYVVGALTAAKERGCTCVSLTCNADCRLAALSDIAIVTPTGAEVIAGSTRMKAGNAQKMVLNMLSTVAMIKTGKVYENLMINLRPTNRKLRRRMIGIVCELAETDETVAERLLNENGWIIREAVDAARGGEMR